MQCALTMTIGLGLILTTLIFIGSSNQTSEMLRNHYTHDYKVKTLHGCRDFTIMARIIPDFKDFHKKDKNHCNNKQES